MVAAAAGQPVSEIARALGVSRPTVRLWCRRFEGGGVAALLRDKPGRGRKPRLAEQTHERLREQDAVAEARAWKGNSSGSLAGGVS